MKKLHIEFDLIANNKTANELIDAPEVCLTDNILEALEATDECESIENFKILSLTSDEEGEVELLHVTRQKVMGLYANAKKLHDAYTSATCINEAESRTIDRSDGIMRVLKNLFGSKCLPDEAKDDTKDEAKEPKPAEPKFKVGDYVRYNGDVRKVVAITKDGKYFLQAISGSIPESDLEPYTEPEENVNLSQETANCDKQFDNILKDGFSKERRLSIAVRMMQALVCAPPIPGVDPNPPAENLAKTAFRLADALIAEAEKGGER